MKQGCWNRGVVTKVVKERCWNIGNKSTTVIDYDIQLWGHYQVVTISMISIVNEVCKCWNRGIVSTP